MIKCISLDKSIFQMHTLLLHGTSGCLLSYLKLEMSYLWIINACNCKMSLFVFHRRNNSMRVWNNIRILIDVSACFTRVHLGVMGLKSTNCTFWQQPRVNGFTPPWNFPVTCDAWINSTSSRLNLVQVKHDLTCSFVVRPLATSTRWKHDRPRTGMKNRAETLMTASL